MNIANLPFLGLSKHLSTKTSKISKNPQSIPNYAYAPANCDTFERNEQTTPHFILRDTGLNMAKKIGYDAIDINNLRRISNKLNSFLVEAPTSKILDRKVFTDSLFELMEIQKNNYVDDLDKLIAVYVLKQVDFMEDSEALNFLDNKENFEKFKPIVELIKSPKIPMDGNNLKKVIDFTKETIITNDL